ncbi:MULTISPECIES: type II toxin-antitoxin system Phd/YefM family antitoxin [Nitrosomonas]|nr:MULTISPECIES: hypothetical protein [Nitrosomonas]
MRIYNIHDAKTQLSRLGEQAAKAGKPMAKVVALRAIGAFSD